MPYKVTKVDYSSILAKGRYCKIYEPGATVTSIPNTLGLMLFDEKIYATNFIAMLKSNYPKFKHPIKLLEVEGIGQQTIPKQICGLTSEKSIYSFYNKEKMSKRLLPLISPMLGTVCYKQVIVGREIEQFDNLYNVWMWREVKHVT